MYVPSEIFRSLIRNREILRILATIPFKKGGDQRRRDLEQLANWANTRAEIQSLRYEDSSKGVVQKILQTETWMRPQLEDVEVASLWWTHR